MLEFLLCSSLDRRREWMSVGLRRCLRFGCEVVAPPSHGTYVRVDWSTVGFEQAYTVARANKFHQVKGSEADFIH